MKVAAASTHRSMMPGHIAGMTLRSRSKV